jgi:protein-tyrosine phosphatase
MQANVFWVAGPWPGRLGILPRPRGGDWLQEETTAWRAAGIDVVVSLLEPEEEAELILAGEAAAAAASGMDFRAFPIPDRGVPASRESVAALADDVADALETGKNVAVHCRQGIGRSGMIVGAVLVAAGMGLHSALTKVNEARGLAVPETQEQHRWLREFASWLAKRQAAQQAATRDERRAARRSNSSRS